MGFLDMLLGGAGSSPDAQGGMFAGFNPNDPRMALIAALMGAKKGQGLAPLGQGLLGMGQMQTANQTRDLQQQIQKMQLASGGIDLKTKEQTFADEQAARDLIKQRMGQPGQQAQPDQPVQLSGPGMDQQAPAQQQSPMPQIGQSQGLSATPFGKSMTVTNAPQGASNGKFDTYNKYNDLANMFESNGLLQRAQQYRDLAEKYRPKLKDEQVRLGQDGNPVVVRNYEDGTTEVSPFKPTANLEYLDTKNVKIPIDKNTGKTAGPSIPIGIDPAEASRLAIERNRLFYDTGMGAGGGQGARPGTATTPGLPPAVQNKITQSQAEGLNTGGVAYKNNLDQTVNTGNDLMTRIAESRKALEQFKPGMGTENFLNIARAAQAAHMPDALVTHIAGGDVASIQEFQKLSAQQAMETLKTAMGGSGRITQAEFKVFQNNNPNIELDPKAIEKIYALAQKTHMRNVAEQSGLNSYLREGGNISAWPTEWTKRIGGGILPASGFRYLGKE